MYLIRANLEILSVKMCDGKFSEQTIAKMEQIVQRMATIEQLEQFDEVIENDNQFHACIIEECGLKGKSVGGAQVSVKHAGFVINKGGASCQDVLDLCKYCSDTVFKEKGVKLEMEIRVTK